MDRSNKSSNMYPQMQEPLSTRFGFATAIVGDGGDHVSRADDQLSRGGPVFLLITNALSIATTTYAIQLLNGFGGAKREQGTFERKLNALLQRAC